MRRLLVVLATLAATTPLLPGVAAHSAADTAPTPVKVATRQYGDRPVFVERNQTLMLRFRGHEGDRVTLGKVYRDQSAGTYYGTVVVGRIRLLNRAGTETHVRPDQTRFFRLPYSGRFILRYKAGDSTAAAGPVQLFVQDRVVFRPGEHLELPKRRGHLYVVRVTVPKGRFDLVSFGTEHYGIVSRGFYLGSQDGGHSVLVGDGYPVVDANPYWGLRSKQLEAGERVLVVLDPSHAAVVDSRPVDVEAMNVDGEPDALPSDPLDTVGVAFQGSAGQLVHIQLDGADTEDLPLVLFGPGRQVVSSSASIHNEVYQLAAAGNYTLVAVRKNDEPLTATVRVASLEDVGSISIDDLGLTLPARTDGRLVLAHIDADGHEFEVSVNPGADATGWWVFAGLLGVDCPPGSPLGCGEGSATMLGPFLLSSTLCCGGVVIADPGTGTPGGVTVRLTSPTP